MGQRYGISVLAVILGWSLGLSAGWAGGISPSAKGTDPASASTALANKTADEYDQAMQIGYAAAEAEDYHTALINFRRALEARPGDRYARGAIANMETYIAQQRAEAAKRRERVQLQEQLQAAVDASDWACAAATVDRLIMLVPPDSSDRDWLVGYRGELSGFLNARSDVDQWSTVCPGVIMP